MTDNVLQPIENPYLTPTASTFGLPSTLLYGLQLTLPQKVKSVLKQVTLWTLIKTRRWEWVEELLAAQPTRTLTLPALLDFSRSLYEEKGVPRKHLRLATAVDEMNVERRDARSRRLLPAELVEGSEVEALFRKVSSEIVETENYTEYQALPFCPFEELERPARCPSVYRIQRSEEAFTPLDTAHLLVRTALLETRTVSILAYQYVAQTACCPLIRSLLLPVGICVVPSVDCQVSPKRYLRRALHAPPLAILGGHHPPKRGGDSRWRAP